MWITAWPASGWRQVSTGSGVGAGIVSGSFLYKWEGEFLKASNKAVADGDYITGRLPRETSSSNRTHVLVREANYHPDGGQVFYPVKAEPFVVLLALPGDDVTPEDFVAFYFDGSFGLQIKADIWHQPVYPVKDQAHFYGKQGAIHACVVMDTVEEFGKFMKVPLKSDYLTSFSFK